MVSNSSGHKFPAGTFTRDLTNMILAVADSDSRVLIIDADHEIATAQAAELPVDLHGVRTWSQMDDTKVVVITENSFRDMSALLADNGVVNPVILSGNKEQRLGEALNQARNATPVVITDNATTAGLFDRLKELRERKAEQSFGIGIGVEGGDSQFPSFDHLNEFLGRSAKLVESEIAIRGTSTYVPVRESQAGPGLELRLD